MFCFYREAAERARREAEEKDRRENVWVKCTIGHDSVQLKFPLKSTIEQVQGVLRVDGHRIERIERRDTQKEEYVQKVIAEAERGITRHRTGTVKEKRVQRAERETLPDLPLLLFFSSLKVKNKIVQELPPKYRKGIYFLQIEDQV